MAALEQVSYAAVRSHYLSRRMLLKCARKMVAHFASTCVGSGRKKGHAHGPRVPVGALQWLVGPMEHTGTCKSNFSTNFVNLRKFAI